MHPDILMLYQEIIKDMNNCLERLDDLGDETRHSVENLIRQDIETLFHAYRKLSEKGQAEVHDLVIGALTIVQRKTKDICQILEKLDVFEVEKQVKLICMRP